MLPQLRRLEAQFPRELVTIGVHAGKFTAERVTANIRQAVLRWGVRHPVVNDRFYRVWRAYDVHAWPTLVLIDPQGHYVGSHAGEITVETFASLVQRLVDQSAAQGTLDRRPLHFRPETEAPQPLAYPGRVHVAGGRLFVADSSHHRLLVLRLVDPGDRAVVEAIVGSGEPGLADGDFAVAAFQRPQGLALLGDVLYVADAENHAVRAVDLRGRRVGTVAGTGRQARHWGLGSYGQSTALNSPWDIVGHGDLLFIAMAGSHQLWRLDLTSGEVSLHAGSGIEALSDGPLLQAALAQPMGLASDRRRLYFADSEASAIRWADVQPGGRVGTLIGTGLFDFGDRDGVGEGARLQHPYSLAWHDGRLYVADTYNDKIRVVDPASQTVTTLLGPGVDGESLDEPEGLAIADGRLYVADTNNHRLRVADLATGRIATLALEGL